MPDNPTQKVTLISEGDIKQADTVATSLRDFNTWLGERFKGRPVEGGEPGERKGGIEGYLKEKEGKRKEDIVKRAAKTVSSIEEAKKILEFDKVAARDAMGNIIPGGVNAFLEIWARRYAMYMAYFGYIRRYQAVAANDPYRELLKLIYRSFSLDTELKVVPANLRNEIESYFRGQFYNALPDNVKEDYFHRRLSMILRGLIGAYHKGEPLPDSLDANVLQEIGRLTQNPLEIEKIINGHKDINAFTENYAKKLFGEYAPKVVAVFMKGRTRYHRPDNIMAGLIQLANEIRGYYAQGSADEVCNIFRGLAKELSGEFETGAVSRYARVRGVGGGDTEEVIGTLKQIIEDNIRIGGDPRRNIPSIFGKEDGAVKDVIEKAREEAEIIARVHSTVINYGKRFLYIAHSAFHAKLDSDIRADMDFWGRLKGDEHLKATVEGLISPYA